MGPKREVLKQPDSDGAALREILIAEADDGQTHWTSRLAALAQTALPGDLLNGFSGGLNWS